MQALIACFLKKIHAARTIVFVALHKNRLDSEKKEKRRDHLTAPL